MDGLLKALVYLTFFMIGLVATWFWLMYSCSVHGNFHFKWDEWTNWILVLVMLFFFGWPVRNMVQGFRKSRKDR